MSQHQTKYSQPTESQRKAVAMMDATMNHTGQASYNYQTGNAYISNGNAAYLIIPDGSVYHAKPVGQDDPEK